MKEDGCTLIELMITLAIIGILLAVGIQSFIKYKEEQEAVAASVKTPQQVESEYKQQYEQEVEQTIKF